MLSRRTPLRSENYTIWVRRAIFVNDRTVVRCWEQHATGSEKACLHIAGRFALCNCTSAVVLPPGETPELGVRLE